MYDFGSVAGNRHIIGAMRSSISAGKVSHAYIIEGASGSGKSLLGNAFAKALLCGEDNPPCGRCYSCRVYESGNHPDAAFVHPTKTKALSVNDIREQVGATVSVMPYSGARKVYLIDDADGMTPAAQNALLKTLEEPPSYAVLILLAKNIDALLPTVRSRCVIFKINPLPQGVIIDYLTGNLNLPEDRARLLAACAQGSIGRASGLASSEDFGELRHRVNRLLRGVYGRELTELFDNAASLEEYKDRIADVLDIAALWYRDLAVCKGVGDAGRVLQRDLAGELAAEAEGLRLVYILKSAERILETKRMLKQNVNFRMAMDMLMLGLGGIR